jgi:hypothetical protein
MPKTPLKHKSDNDVQEIITTGVDNEYNYLAYLAGLELETASGTYSESVLGSLGKTLQSLDLSIGTFTNTRRDGDVGEYGSSALNITTTDTIVYQQDATYSEPSNFRNPLYQLQQVGNRTRIQEFNDADQLELGEILAGIIYANNYPGTFKIATSTPSGGYTVAVSNFLQDTRADGTTNYNLYQRTSLPSEDIPSAINLMAVARGTSSPFNAKTGTYRGLKIMSDAHRRETVKACLDRYLSTITGSVKPIGSYLIRTSTPTETGTWAEKGTIFDKRNEVAEETVGSSTTTTYSNINSNNHWQVTSSTPQDFFDGISVKVGGSVVASAGASDTSDTTLTGTSNGKTYTRGTAVSGAPSGSQWYTFTETVGSSSQEDVIQSSTETIATYKLYVRTA